MTLSLYRLENEKEGGSEMSLILTGILGAAAAATGGFGIFKSAKAVKDSCKANGINAEAQKLYDDMKSSLQAVRDETSAALTQLGNKKLYMYNVPVMRFVSLFEKVKNIELSESKGLAELSKFKIDKEAVVQMKDVCIKATSFAQGAVGGAVAGGAMAFGAYGAAGAFASASTGAAISGLSGAAATNATLAFFGGGSLAAGGLGITGGMCILGGIVAGPALAVLGTVMGAKASAGLDNAHANMAKVKEAGIEVAVMKQTCWAITERAKMYTQMLVKYDRLVFPMLNNFDGIIREEGTDYRKYKKSSRGKIGALLSSMQSIKAMLDTPLLDEKGGLTAASEKVLDAVRF